MTDYRWLGDITGDRPHDPEDPTPMTMTTPPQWALDKVARLNGFKHWEDALNIAYPGRVIAMRHHAADIAKYEPAPVDPVEEAFVRVLQVCGGDDDYWTCERVKQFYGYPATLASFRAELDNLRPPLKLTEAERLELAREAVARHSEKCRDLETAIRTQKGEKDTFFDVQSALRAVNVVCDKLGVAK